MSTLIRLLATASVFFMAAIIAVPANAALLNDIFTRTTQARDRATEARNAARETRDNIREGRQNLTNELRTAISEAKEDLQDMILDNRAKRQAFVGQNGCSANCEVFRSDLITLVNNTETAMNRVIETTSLPAQLNFDDERDLVGNAQGRVLYPLYRVLVERNTLLNSLIDTTSGVAESINTIELDECEIILGNEEDFNSAKTALKLYSTYFKIVGKKLQASGETTITEGDIGIHGYVHVTAKTNPEKKWAARFTGLSDALSSLSKTAGEKQKFCTLRMEHENLLVQQETILQGQQALLQEICALTRFRSANCQALLP